MNYGKNIVRAATGGFSKGEIAGLAVAATAVYFAKGALAKIPYVGPAVSKLESVPVVGAALPTILVGAIVGSFGAKGKNPGAQANFLDHLGSGIVAVGIISAGKSLADQVVSRVAPSVPLAAPIDFNMLAGTPEREDAGPVGRILEAKQFGAIVEGRNFQMLGNVPMSAYVGLGDDVEGL